MGENHMKINVIVETVTKEKTTRKTIQVPEEFELVKRCWNFYPKPYSIPSGPYRCVNYYLKPNEKQIRENTAQLNLFPSGATYVDTPYGAISID